MEVKGYEPLETKQDADAFSIQLRATEPPPYTGVDLLLMSQVGQLAPPWWSPQRDAYLSREWMRCPMFAGAVFNIGAKLATVPPIVEPRDPTVARDRALAEQYLVRLYEGSEFGRGFIEFMERWLRDRWTSDNGAFAEVLGDGRKDGPIQGPALGIANLDSSRCIRTGYPEYPVVYLRADGRRYKLHRTRVIYGSQQPSTRDEMHGVGLCWFSRSLDISLSILDDLIYKQEKLGRRPKRGILVGRRMTVDQVQTAFRLADEAADNAGLSRYALFPVIANPNAADVGIDVIDLASLPDGFDWKDDVNICAYILALTGGFPVRWIWPATVVGATKADAMIQHMVGAMSGTAYELNTLANLLGGNERGLVHQAGKFLPPTLRIRFDIVDDWTDEIQSNIQRTRSERYERNLTSGAVTIRVTREQMLANGEISEAQFRDMELASGRTQDGLPVDSLFYGDNPYLSGIDPRATTVEQVEATLAAAKMASVREHGPDTRFQAKEAVAALEWLLGKIRGDSTADRPLDRQEGSDSKGGKEEMLKERSDLEADGTRELAAVLSRIEDELISAWEEGEEEEEDWQGWQRLLTGALLILLLRAFIARVDELSEEIGVFLDPGQVSDWAFSWATTAAGQRAALLMSSTRRMMDRIRQSLQSGAINLDQARELTSRVFSEMRAEVIAITEITVASSAAASWFADQLSSGFGLSAGLYWATARDERVCEAVCVPLDGKDQSIWSSQFPDGPPAHARCRCQLVIRVGSVA